MKKMILNFDYSTRPKRIDSLTNVICALEQISLAEESYRDSMSEYYQSSDEFDITEDCIFLLAEAIDTLHSVYDY